MASGWFQRQWPHSEGGDRSESFAIQALWSPPLSQCSDISADDAESQARGLGFDLEQAIRSSMSAVLATEDVPEIEVEEEMVGPAAEGMVTEFIATLWDNKRNIPASISTLADIYATAELLGRIKRHFKVQQAQSPASTAQVELSFTPEPLASVCKWHVSETYDDDQPLRHSIGILEEPDSIEAPSERLQYEVMISGQYEYVYRIDSTGTIHDHRIVGAHEVENVKGSSVIPDVDEWPVRKPLIRDWETGEQVRKWPSQDGTDRSASIAIMGGGRSDPIIPDEFTKPLLQSVVREAVQEVLPDATLFNLTAEDFEIGPAAGAVEDFIVTFFDSREVMLQLVGGVVDSWAVYEIVSRVRRKLKSNEATERNANQSIRVFFPAGTLVMLCEEFVKRKYHPRAHLTPEWYCLTQEFYSGYQSPGHPTETVEYLILISTSKETYRFRIWGNGNVQGHSVRRGRLDAELPLPDLFEGETGHSKTTNSSC